MNLTQPNPQPDGPSPMRGIRLAGLCATSLALSFTVARSGTAALGNAGGETQNLEAGVSANPKYLEIREKNREAFQAARGLIGKPCAPHLPPENAPGYAPIPGFVPISVNGGFVHARGKDGRRYAFLLVMPDLDDANSCRIADVVALPSAKEANAFLWCDGPDIRGPGIGMRLAGKREIVDYWYIDVAAARLEAIFMDEKANKSTRCQVPEYGE